MLTVNINICDICQKPVHYNVLLNRIIKWFVHYVVPRMILFYKVRKKKTGKDWIKKKRPRTSYLEVNSEFLSADISRSEKVLPIGVLKNGHRAELQPVKISTGDRVILSNTCTFDAITQILCCTYCDSVISKNVIQENENKIEMCKLVITMLREGIKAMSYEHRANILSKFIQKKNSIQGLKTINCESTITDMYKNIWGQYFNSGTEMLNCK